MQQANQLQPSDLSGREPPFGNLLAVASGRGRADLVQSRELMVGRRLRFTVVPEVASRPPSGCSSREDPALGRRASCPSGTQSVWWQWERRDKDELKLPRPKWAQVASSLRPQSVSPAPESRRAYLSRWKCLSSSPPRPRAMSDKCNDLLLASSPGPQLTRLLRASHEPFGLSRPA